MSHFNAGDKVRILSEKSVAEGKTGVVSKPEGPFVDGIQVRVERSPLDVYYARFAPWNLEKIENEPENTSSKTSGIQVEKEESFVIRLSGQDAADFRKLINELKYGDPFMDVDDLKRIDNIGDLVSKLSRALKD